MIVFNPVLQLAGYNRLDGHNAVDGYQTQTPASPDSPEPDLQWLTAGSYQTVSRPCR